MYSRTEGNVLIYALGKRIWLLEYHTHGFSKFHGIPVLDISVVNQYFTLGSKIVYQIVHAVKASYESRFSTPARAYYGSYLIFFQAHAYVFQCLLISIPCA